MKRLFLLVALFISLPLSATSVRVKGSSLYQVIDSSRAWSSVQSSATMDYIIDPPSAAAGACVQIWNQNTTNARSVSAQAYMTLYPYATGFNSADPLYVFEESDNYSVPSSQSQTHFFKVFGAAHWVLHLFNGTGTAGGSSDTYTIYVSYGPGCPEGAQSLSSGISSPAIVVPPTQWTAPSSPAVSAQAIASQPASSGRTHIASCITACMAQSGTTATEQNFQITDGTCGGTILYVGVIGVTSSTGDSKCWGQCGLQIAAATGDAMTACFGGAATGVFERITLIGYDQ